jgi:hypothetical protein
MPTESQLSQILQQFHGVEDEIREAREQAKCWDALKNICIHDRYRDGELTLILNVNAAVEINDVRPGKVEHRERVSPTNFTVFISHNNIFDHNGGSQPDQQQMLVGNVEFVKGVNNAILPAFVRLYFGDDHIEKFVASGIYFNAMKSRFDVLSRRAYGEVVVLRNGPRCVPLENTAPSEIESRVEIMDSISNDQRQAQTSALRVWEIMYQRLIASVTIFLDYRGVRFFERQDGGLKIVDMFIGPIDFQSGISELSSHDTESTRKTIG